VDTGQPEAQIELRDKTEWVVFRCGDTDVAVALVWEVHKDDIFLRVHQKMEIAQEPK
jgi:hypothetical protein